MVLVFATQQFSRGLKARTWTKLVHPETWTTGITQATHMLSAFSISGDEPLLVDGHLVTGRASLDLEDAAKL